MFLPLGALLYPLANQFPLPDRQHPLRVRRRHQVVGIGRGDAAVQLTGIRLARGDDNETVLQPGKRPLARMKLQIGLAGVFVRAVTGKTAVRKQRLDLALKVNRLTERGSRARNKAQHQAKSPVKNRIHYGGKLPRRWPLANANLQSRRRSCSALGQVSCYAAAGPFSR